MNSASFTITQYRHNSLPFISAEVSFSHVKCSFYLSVAMALIETQLRLSHISRLNRIHIEFYIRKEFTIAEALKYRQQSEVRSLYMKILELFESQKSPLFKLLSFQSYLSTTKDCVFALEHIIKIIILPLLSLDNSNQNKIKLNIYDSQNNDAILRKLSEVFMVKFVKLKDQGIIEEFIADGEREFPIIYIYEQSETFKILYTEDMRACFEDEGFDFGKFELLPNMYSNVIARAQSFNEDRVELVGDTSENYDTVPNFIPNTYQIPLPGSKKEENSQMLDDLLNLLEVFSEAYEPYESKNSAIINQSKRLVNNYGEFNELHAFSKLTQEKMNYPGFNTINPTSLKSNSNYLNAFPNIGIGRDINKDSLKALNNYSTVKQQIYHNQSFSVANFNDFKGSLPNSNLAPKPTSINAPDPHFQPSINQPKLPISYQNFPIEDRGYKQDLGFSTVQPIKFKPNQQKITNKYCEYEQKHVDESLFIDISCTNCNVCNDCRLKERERCIQCKRDYSDYELTILCIIFDSKNS